MTKVPVRDTVCRKWLSLNFKEIKFLTLNFIKMKQKMVLFITVTLLAFTFNTNAQTKSGIFKKDYYGTRTADQWEEYLSGNNSNDFNKIANVELKTYLEKGVGPYVAKKLGEPSIASAVANSTVVSIPEGTDVLTVNTAGEWITRKAYPGEKGFMHTSTGIFWLSFQCGNLVDIVLGKPKPGYNPGNTNSGTFTGNQSNAAPATGSGYTNTLTVNGSGQQNSTWSSDYEKFSAGMGTMQMAYQQSFMLFKMAQDAKQCCGAGTQQNVVAVPNVYATTVAYPTGQPQQVVVANTKLPFGQTWVGNATATAAGNILADGIEWVIDRVSGRRIPYRNGQQVYYYNNGWNNTPGSGGVFQGSNQLNSSVPTNYFAPNSFGASGNTWGNSYGVPL